MAMAKKHVDGSRTVTSGKVRVSRYTTKISNEGSPSQKSTLNKKGEPHVQRLTPIRSHSQSPQGNLGSIPRTSPGLLAGHYAGCKFSEPPITIGSSSAPTTLDASNSSGGNVTAIEISSIFNKLSNAQGQFLACTDL
ncbi:hypothetical protein NQ317_006724 [Molorchus minor]|uniref:Uncharacterized protein n=1 Tax=Molorchus minor TaxID=1323400 RepID=A0ABQ9JZZ5_9CUCU|nr:hypothetical protein NQ317_006724 [Molorchus minor]